MGFPLLILIPLLWSVVSCEAWFLKGAIGLAPESVVAKWWASSRERATNGLCRGSPILDSLPSFTCAPSVALGLSFSQPVIHAASTLNLHSRRVFAGKYCCVQWNPYPPHRWRVKPKHARLVYKYLPFRIQPCPAPVGFPSCQYPTNDSLQLACLIAFLLCRQVRAEVHRVASAEIHRGVRDVPDVPQPQHNPHQGPRVEAVLRALPGG